MVGLWRRGNKALDLSDLLSKDSVDEENLDDYLHFEQVGNNVKVYIDENGSFTGDSFNEDDASKVVTLYDTYVDTSASQNDVINTLIESQKIVLDS